MRREKLKKIGNLSIGVGGYNFDSHNGRRIACVNKTACYGDGPSGVKPNEAFAWDEGDVEINPGLYQIPYWIMLPKKTDVRNFLNIAK